MTVASRADLPGCSWNLSLKYRNARSPSTRKRIIATSFARPRRKKPGYVDHRRLRISLSIEHVRCNTGRGSGLLGSRWCAKLCAGGSWHHLPRWAHPGRRQFRQIGLNIIFKKSTGNIRNSRRVSIPGPDIDTRVHTYTAATWGREDCAVSR